MSDLQCPATVLIARHGEAKPAVGIVPGDGGSLTDKGYGQVRHLVEQVRERRVAALYTSWVPAAARSAEVAAAELGLRPVVVEGLEELVADDLAGTRFTQAIGEIADTHRGETVLVFTHAGAMLQAIPALRVTAGQDLASPDREALGLAGQGEDPAPLIPHCAVAVVEVDADGWRLVSGPSLGAI